MPKPSICLPVTWDLERSSSAPAVYPAEGFSGAGVKALFFEGETYQGRPTRVFAWMGLPWCRKGERCPAMVLLHGGGGTAFDEWVRIWNRRGYAAIAIDQCGSVPEQPVPALGGVVHARHLHSGPSGWDASFKTVQEPVKDQWPYHAVAAILRAHSLLAAQPEVDALRIGITGISWGGYMTALMAGIDERYRCAIPVYGCGDLGKDSHWKDHVFPGLPARDVAEWLRLWDPSHYLPAAKMPMLWVSGTNDFAYPLPSLQASAALPAGSSDLCVRVEMPHSHPDGWSPAEIALFADQHLAGAAPLPRITAEGREGPLLFCTATSPRPISSAEICFTRATGTWQDRKFNRLPAQINPETGRISASIPPLTTVAFLNVTDDRNVTVSTRFIEL